MNDYLSKWCCLIIFHQHDAEQLISKLSEINCTKHLYSDKEINEESELDKEPIEKFLLQDGNTGEQMKNAFENAFDKGFRKVVLIRNNFNQLQPDQILEAFNCLKMIEFCIGPKANGDYYLIAMNYFEPSLFNNKQWDSPSLVKETIKDIGKLKLATYKLKTF